MATLQTLLETVQLLVAEATSGLSMFNSPVLVNTGTGWPPVQTVQQIVKMSPPTALVSVFDRKTGHDSTRWIPATVAQMVVLSSVASSPTSQTILPFGVGSIAISGTPAPGDAVSLVVYAPGVWGAADPGDGSYTATPTGAGVASAAPGDSSSALARALAATVAATPALAATVAATSSGPLVTVTNLTNRVIVVSTFTGNGAVNTTEIGRRMRDLQIVTWSPTPEVLDLVCDPIEAMVAQIEMFRGSQGQFFAGLPFPDGTSGRLRALNDYRIDDATLTDLYRRDIWVSVDYPVTVKDQLYAVLAPILSYQLTA